MDKAAQEYLMNLEKERLRAVERGGVEAGQRLIEGHKRKAAYLAGDDDKKKTVMANAARKRLRDKPVNQQGGPVITTPVKRNNPIPTAKQFLGANRAK